MNKAIIKIKQELQARNPGMSSYEARYHANRIIHRIVSQSLEDEAIEVTREKAEAAITRWEQEIGS